MLQHIGIGILACAFVGSWTWMLLRARPKVAGRRSSGPRPLTEGYVVKGGQNAFPSQIKDRPPAPGAVKRVNVTMPGSATIAGNIIEPREHDPQTDAISALNNWNG